jgi:hypothetical protein
MVMWPRKRSRTRAEGGLQGAGPLESCWHAHRLEGWLVLGRPFPLSAQQLPLQVHAGWAGPFKLVGRPGEVEERAEVFLGSQGGEDSSSLNPEALCQELLGLAATAKQPEQAVEWEPPEASLLAAWLAAAGWEPTIDGADRLSLTLRRPGCEGQLRIERGAGRLRLVLPLGHWPQLEPCGERAIYALAARVNAGIRMARIVWICSGSERRCEAQVDLSGLPVPAPACPWREGLWRRWLPRAAGALELALRQLGLELAVLANPSYRSLAERVAAGCPAQLAGDSSGTPNPAEGRQTLLEKG